MRSEIRIQLNLFSRRIASCPTRIYRVICIFPITLKQGYYQILIVFICLDLFLYSLFIISLIFLFLYQYQTFNYCNKMIALYLPFLWLFSLPSLNIYLFYAPSQLKFLWSRNCCLSTFIALATWLFFFPPCSHLPHSV